MILVRPFQFQICYDFLPGTYARFRCIWRMKACPAQCSRQLGRKRYFDAGSNGGARHCISSWQGLTLALVPCEKWGRRYSFALWGILLAMYSCFYIWSHKYHVNEVFYVFVWLYFCWGILYVCSFSEWKVKKPPGHYYSVVDSCLSGLFHWDLESRSMMRFSTGPPKVTVSSAAFSCISPSHIYAS